jgi:putative addiction module component (TIGR02574 family)
LFIPNLGAIFSPMSKVTLADVLELSVSERIQLAEDIWDSVATMPQPIRLTEAQREELDRRLDDYHQHPEDGISWESLKGQILGRT